MRIILTGAGGFIGKHLLNALGESSHELIVLSRRKDIAMPANATLLRGDLANVGSMVNDFRAADIVIHMASELRNESLMERVNHEYAREIIRVSSEAGVTNFIHLSSVGVTGFGHHNRIAICTETTECHPSNRYEQTKYRGEKAILDHADAAMRKVVLRPTNVFGDEHPRHALLPLLRRIQRRQWIPFARGSRVNYVYVGDVVDAIHIAVETPTLNGVFQVGAATETGEFIDGIARTLGVSARSINMPASVISGMARLLPGDSSSKLKSLCNFAEYSSALLLASTPMKFEMWKGIQRTMAWYKKEGLL